MSSVIRYRAPLNRWKYVRFTLVLTRGQYSGIFQISEFTLKYQGTVVSYAGVSITPVVGGGEGTASLIDGNLGSKAFAIGATFTIYNPTSFLFDTYTWGTANDVPDRDPVRWIIDASQDNINWTVLDDKSGADQTITTNRNTYVQDFPILNARSGVEATIRLNNQVNANANQTFIGTSAVQTFTVPNGVFWIRFFLWGAGGTCQDGSKVARPDVAGSGAYTEGNLRTAPGTVFYIIVGRAGLTGLANGGGGSGVVGTNGGGFTGIFSGSPAFGNAIAIAGGGGGAGINSGGNGGGGGYPAGANSSAGTAPGGTQTAGGVGSAGTGSQLQGASGGMGGGGGGYYGGGAATGGGSGPGGGGGSSYYSSAVLNPITVNGLSTTANGTNTPAANETSLLWVSPYGRSGYDGYAVIGFNTNTNAAPLQITLANFPITSGGVITTLGPYKVHTFRTVGTATFTTNKQVTAEVLVVGGGGGGGDNVGGGGGAGAALYSSVFSIPAGSYTITIGGGGAPNTNGSSSIFSSLTAVGGGRGGTWRGGSGASGGCGGGGAGDSGVGAAGTVGFAGGSSTGNISSGGGGGMGGTGFNAVVGKSEGGVGGLGATYSVGGASYLVCGGGGGSSYRTAPAVIAAGGSGIGGSGANSEFGPGPTNPTPNTGSGGGGGGGGTSGASGIIVIALIPYLS